MLNAGVRSVFSSHGPAASVHSQLESRNERMEEGRREVAERKAPSVMRGRPRKDENREWDRSREFHTSIAMNRDQYVELTDIAYEERISLKLAMNRLLAIGIREYRKKPGLLR